MKTMIAVPCMDMVHTLFAASLVGMRLFGEVQFSWEMSSLIYTSRNSIALKAIEGGFDRILWLDSDMKFDADLFERMHKRLDEGRDLVSAICVTRKPPFRTCIYNDVGFDVDKEKNMAIPHAKTFTEYPANDIFEIEACGFGCLMMNVPMLKAVTEKHGVPFSPILGFGEDLSFCMRAKELGYKLHCDSSIKVGHIGLMTYTEDILGGTQCIKS